MKELQTKVISNGDTHVLISKHEFAERWVEIKEGKLGKEVILHQDSNFGGTEKHESVFLFAEDIKALAAIL